jgi:hypothetical protein
VLLRRDPALPPPRQRHPRLPEAAAGRRRRPRGGDRRRARRGRRPGRGAGLAEEGWSPGELDDAALEKLLGRAALERARALRRRGVLAEVVRGTFEGDSLPRVKLQTSTVSFLVPGDASYAKCDCRLRTACEHVAVAVWAFRIADEKDRAALALTVEVADRIASSDERRDAALEARATWPRRCCSRA